MKYTKVHICIKYTKVHICIKYTKVHICMKYTYVWSTQRLIYVWSIQRFTYVYVVLTNVACRVGLTREWSMLKLTCVWMLKGSPVNEVCGDDPIGLSGGFPVHLYDSWPRCLDNGRVHSLGGGLERLSVDPLPHPTAIYRQEKYTLTRSITSTQIIQSIKSTQM